MPLRLEAVDGDGLRFWEISRTAATVTRRYGRVPNAGRVVVKTHPDAATAEAAIARAVAAKRAEGFAERRLRAEPSSTSRPGVSTLNPELDALVDEDPTDHERYLVYADWLQHEGDPRGELAIVQHALAQAPASDTVDALEEAEARLFERFGAELLGPLAPLRLLRNGRTRRLGDVRYRGLAWRCGFVRALRLDQLAFTDSESVAFLRAAVPHPSLRHLEHLVVAAEDEQPFGAAFPPLPTVRSLRVGVHYRGGRSVGFAPSFWTDTVPGLRRLACARQVTSFGTARLPALERLALERLDDVTLEAALAVDFPGVEDLRLTITGESTNLPARLEALRARMPRLTTLTVTRRILLSDRRGNPYPQREDALAKAVVAAASGLHLHLIMAFAEEPPRAPHVTVAEEPPEEVPETIDRFHLGTDAAPLP